MIIVNWSWRVFKKKGVSMNNQKCIVNGTGLRLQRHYFFLLHFACRDLLRDVSNVFSQAPTFDSSSSIVLMLPLGPPKNFGLITWRNCSLREQETSTLRFREKVSSYDPKGIAGYTFSNLKIWCAAPVTHW